MLPPISQLPGTIMRASVPCAWTPQMLFLLALCHNAPALAATDSTLLNMPLVHRAAGVASHTSYSFLLISLQNLLHFLLPLPLCCAGRLVLLTSPRTSTCCAGTRAWW
jgi:hypothetical protein